MITLADISKSTDELKIGFQFEDDDTRLVTVKNPMQNLTASAIKEVTDYFINNKVIIGDKDTTTAQMPVSVYTCYREEINTTQLDLTQD